MREEGIDVKSCVDGFSIEEYVNLEVLEQEVPLRDFGMEGMKQCRTQIGVLDSSLEQAKWSLE